MRQAEIPGFFAADRAAFVAFLAALQEDLSALAARHHPGTGNLPFHAAFTESEQDITESGQPQQQQGIKQKAFFQIQGNIHRSFPKCGYYVKLVTVEFFLNNEKHETARKKFMGSCFDCENALFIP